MKRLKRVGWVAAYLATAGVLILFLRRIDLDSPRGLGFIFWARAISGLVVVQLLTVALHSLQWGILLRHEGIQIRAARIFGARLAGAAISILSPSLSVGGEVVRAALVRAPMLPTDKIAATVTIDKFVELATRVPVLGVGLWVLLSRLPRLNPLFLGAGLAFVVVILIAPVVLALLLRRAAPRRHGAFVRRFERVIDRVRPGLGYRIVRGLTGFVGSLRLRRPAILVPLLVIGLIAAGMELLQIHFALNLIGIPGAEDAVAVQSASILGGIFGILPANLGGMETMNLLSITLLGGSAAAALSYSMLLRGGQAGTVLLGLLYLAARRLRPPEAGARVGQCCSNE